MPTVRIEVDHDIGKVYSPWGEQRVATIKRMPDRVWRDDGRYWEVPARGIPALKKALEADGDSVIVTTHDAERKRWDAERKQLEVERQRLQQEVIGLKSKAAAGTRTWAEELLGRLTPEQADQVFKALTRVLHPDVGGNGGLMKQLNVARDFLSTRF